MKKAPILGHWQRAALLCHGQRLERQIMRPAPSLVVKVRIMVSQFIIKLKMVNFTSKRLKVGGT